jgi:glycosyltransferase involved in cell wall biosynthesis
MTFHNTWASRSGVEWSLAMIVRDAETQIGPLLDEASVVCDELVIIDTGSIDETRTVAAEHGAKVFEFEWVDDFAAARNASFEHCSGRWILWLDADDRLPPGALEGFRTLKRHLRNGSDANVVMVPYNYHFSPSDPTMCTFSFERERLVRRSASPRWAGPVHEVIVAPGPTMRWPIAWVDHRPRPEDRASKVGRNLRILERAVADGDRSSRTLFYLANELRDHDRWDDALTVYKEYLEFVGTAVWEQHAALLSMAVCAELLGREEEKLTYLHAAVRRDSTRAEAFLRLGLHFYNRQEWRQAIPFFAAASVLPRPEEGFVDDVAYTWGPWDYLSVCHSELGMYEDALKETLKALPTSKERDRLYANMRFYFERLRQLEAE